MKRLINPMKRALISCSTLAAVGVLAHGMFSNQATAQEVPTCASLNLPNPIVLTGSSAVRPVIIAVGAALSDASVAAADRITLLYNSAGSCDGVNNIVTNKTLTGNALYWTTNPDPTKAPVQNTCALGTEKATIGLADVFPTSCPGIDAAGLAGVGDFQGPVQSMNFVAPIGSTQTSISAEAAYLVVGFGAQSETDWSDPAQYAFRNFQSGTQTMMGKAIGIDASLWPAAADKGGSGAVLSFVTAGGENTLGILASNEADGARDKVKRLAFQGYGQKCTFYPDSSYSSRDKLNVRNGHYAVWGPLHMLTKVTAGVPVNPIAAKFVDVMTEKATVAGVDAVGLQIDANTTPQCAMNVQRTAEMGKITAFTPEKSCKCFFDTKTMGDTAGCKACTAANAATTCTGDTPVCNHGFCEAK